MTDAEPLTGCKVGSISSSGQVGKVPVALDEAVLMHKLIFINGGQRRLQAPIALDAFAARGSNVAALIAAPDRRLFTTRQFASG